MSATEDENTDDGIPRPRNEISIRDYERRQLTEFLPDVIDIYAEYEDEAMVEKKEAFEEMLDEFEAEIDGTEANYDLGSNNWRDLAVGLEELDDTRASWLKAKIGRRAELSTIHMGFTTNVPFMTLVTGNDPVRPDRQ
jgi:DNA repair ATPase RecN